MSSEQDRIDRLTRERDLARTVALEAMRTMTDAQLVELKGAMDKRGSLPADYLPELATVDISQPGS